MSTNDTVNDLPEDLDVLACDFAKRPKDAPSFFDLQGAIRAIVRESGALRVEFDPAAASAVEQLAAAERLCCSTLTST